jgi:hypothetical protein
MTISKGNPCPRGGGRMSIKANPLGMTRAGWAVYSSPPCQIAQLATA